MKMRLRERWFEDELLKRELLLRLRAAHSDAPGQSAPASGYFRRLARRLLLRHPLFARRYHMLAKELDLAGAQPLVSFGWLVRARQLLVVPARLVRVQQARRSATVAAVKRQGPVWREHVVRAGLRARAFPGRVVALLIAVRLGLRRFKPSRVVRGRLESRGRVALGLLAVVGLAAAAAVGTLASESSGPTRTTASAKSPSAPQTADAFSHPPRAVSTPIAAAPARVHTRKRVDRRTAGPARHARLPKERLALVSATVQIATTEQFRPASPAGGPVPLQAPPAAPAPSPMKAPQR
jgi:hypothetical protein